MANPKLPGKTTTRPDNFKPTESRIAGSYTYVFDYENGVGARLARTGSAEPSVYFLMPPPAKESVKSSKPRRWTKVALTAMAAAALVLLVYPYYPAVEYQAQQALRQPAQAADATVPLTSDNQLIIPAIGVRTPVVEGSSLSVLLKHNGVWHQTGALPSSSLVLAGHRFRYLPPNTSTLYNLGKLKVGDVMLVDWFGRRYSYQVSAVQAIPASDTDILQQHTEPNHLYVYTCQDYKMTQRILVTASLIP
jgi:LPXTG-site transpeptidase (sortase) family protein